MASAIVVVLTTWIAGPTQAFVGGETPSLLVRHTVFGDGFGVGNTLMEHDGTQNFQLRPLGSQQSVPAFRLPPDGEVVRAFLFWSGSTDPVFGPDRDVDLTLPDGTFLNDLSVDFPEPGEPPSALNRCTSLDSAGNTPVGFFACRREVTALLQNLGPGGAAGTYTVNDVDALAGNCAVDPFCQAAYAGWALVVVWESPTETVRRDVALYDAFLAVDEQSGPFSSGVSSFFTLDNFLVGGDGEGELTFMGFEGDAQLGTPPQDSPLINPPTNFCPTCADFIEVRSTSGGGTSRLSDPNNAPGNIFNGSNNTSGGPHPGLDIDSFDIGASGSGVLSVGDTSLQLRVGSGDGLLGGQAGGGELVFLGFTLLTLDTLSPRFNNANTEKNVDRALAGPGEVLTYTLQVFNDGSAAASNTIVRDQLPASVTYLPNSTTTTCGVAAGDIGGTSPVLRPAGLNLGNLPTNSGCDVTFQVRIDNATADGTVLNNFFTVEADSVDALTVGPATTTVEGLQIATPTKAVSVLGGGTPSPGASLVYTIRITNIGGRDAPDLAIADTLPAELEFISSLSVPPGATDNSAGQNISVTGIDVDADEFVEFTFAARIRASTPAGTVILNQATVDIGADVLLTDDPAVGGGQDPTTVVVESDVNLGTSTKSVTIDGGGLAEPGGTLTYTIDIRQSGAANEIVLVNDDLPPNVGNCQVIASPPGGFANCAPGGANGTGLLTGAAPLTPGGTATIVFRVTIDGAAPDGALITNAARLIPQSDPAGTFTATSPTVEVFARPVFSASRKSAVDVNGGDLRPGDIVRYSIVVENTGSIPATNVEVEDELPAALAFVSATAGGTAAGQTVSWSLPALAVDAQSTVTVDARVRAGTPNGTLLTNVGRLTADAPADPFTTPPANLTVVATPELIVEKTVIDTGAAPFRPTDVVRYTIVVRNAGDGAAENVEVRDAVDANFAETLLTSGGRIEGGQVVFDATTIPSLATIAPGGSETLTFDARLASSIANGTVVSNQAFTTADGVVAVASDDPATAPANDPTDFTIVSEALVSMTKVFVDLDGGATLPGDQVQVRLTLENAGDAPGTNVEVQDPLDARLTFVSSATGGTLAGNTVVFNAGGAPQLARIDAGDVVELTFVAEVAFPLADGTLIPNQARALSPAFADVLSDDPATPPVGDPTVLRVESRPVFDDATKSVVDIDGDGIFEPQDRVRYTIVIENTGSENAANVVVTDPIPAGLVDIVPEAGGVVTGGNIVWSGASNPQLATVDVGERITLAFQAEIDRPLPNATIIDNQATITGDNVVATPTDDPATPAVDDPTRIIVESHPELLVEKTVLDGNGGVVEPGDVLSYTIRIRNAGDRAATNVVVRDPLDVALTNIVAQNGGFVDAGEIVWNATTTPALAALNIDQQVVIGFTATVRSPLANGTLIENQAQVATDDPTVPGQPFLSDDPTTPASPDATIVQVVSAANLTTSTMESFDLVGAPIETANPADPIRYNLLLANTGNETATDVVVTIPIPAELIVEAAPGGTIGPGFVTFSSATTPALASLAPGETIPLSFDTRVIFPLDNGAEISVQAQLLADGIVAPFVTDDPSTAAVSDPTRVTVISQVDLSDFEKTVADTGPAPFEPGDIVQYTLIVRNSGDAPARDVVVRDPLPAELEFVSSTSGGVLIGNEVVFTAGQEPDLAVINPGDPDVVLRFEARVLSTVVAGTSVANQAAVQPIGGAIELSDDPATGVVDDPTRFNVVTVPRLTLTKDLQGPNGRIFAPGDVATYTFVLTSSGTGATGPVDFLDLVPAPLVSVTTTGGLAFNAGTQTASASVPSLAPGETVTFTLSGTIAEGTPNGTRLENQAQAQGIDIGLVQSDDPTTPAPDDATIGIVEATPILVVAKTFFDENAGTILPGDIGRIDIVLRNDGNGRADDVQVRDALAPEFEIVEVLDGGAVTLNTVSWNQDLNPALTSIAPGETTTLRVRVRVRSTVEDGTAIANQAEVNSPDLEATVLSDDPGTPAPNDPTVIVVAAPRLVFDKRFVDVGGEPVLRPGAQIRYDLVIRNEGSAPATNVSVTDVIPLELVDVSAGQGGSLADGQASWDETTTAALGVIAVGGEVIVTLSGTVDPLTLGGTVISNQAEVVADQVGIPVRSDDPSTAEDQDPTARTVVAEERFTGEVALFDVETDLPIIAPVVPNQRVRAVVTFRNEGTQTAQALVLRIPFAAARFNIDTASLGGIVDATEVRWTASQDDAFRFVAPGDEIQVSVEGAIASPIPDGTTIDVLANAESVSNPDTVWTFGPAQMVVRSRPDLSATTKEVIDDNGGLVEPGDVLTYRITVINGGGAEANGVMVHDPTPSGTAYVSGSAQLRGEPVADAAVGANPFANGLAIGDVPAGRSAVIRFQVRVTLAALRGVRIENQATLRAENASDAVSDNPATPLVVGDATAVLVGGGPLLVASKTANPSSVATGGEVSFTIAVENGGSDLARQIEINDAIRQAGAYVPNTTTIDGTLFTDADDGDPVTITPIADGVQMRIVRDVLEAGEGFAVNYRVRALGTGALRNQATVQSATLPQFLTDADPNVPGAQETVVPLQGTRAILIDTDSMELRDATGDLLEAGDGVTGRAVVRNRGIETVVLSNFAVDVSVGLLVTGADIDDPRFEVVNTPTTQIRQRAGETLEVEPGESFTIGFRGAVVDTAVRGDPIRAAGTLTATTLDGAVAQAVDLGRAELVVGLMPGTAAREGTIYLDNGERNEAFDPAPSGDGDLRASGFQVLAFRAGQPDNEPVKTSVTDESGRYELAPLPAGNYRYEIRSASGAVFREVELGAIQGGTSDRDAHLRIDPSGAIYNAITFDAVRNQRVFLYVDDGDEDLTNDALVPESDLLPGQQGQVTTTQGLYRFDPLPGSYRIGIEPSSQLLSWPSTEIDFERGTGNHPLGAVAEPAADGTIVGHPIPNAALDRTYFLRFNLAEDLPPVLNNHIPLDSLRDQVRIQKTANRRRLTIGDIVTYTVRVENRAENGIAVSDGGVEIVDTLPQGFRLIEGGWRVDRIDTDAIGQQRRVALTNVQVSGRRQLTFGAFPLQGRTTYELRYQVVVGPGARFGNADNRALLRTALGDVPVTEQSIARVKVVADQTFDLGSLRAKVFCDDNADGIQNPGELGVAGARVYLDTGFFAEADLYGKLHFTAIPPGTHLVKIDERTLPPGTTLIGDVRQNFYISRGLPAQVSYRAQCRFVTSNRPKVTLNEAVYRGPGEATAPTRSVTVEGAVSTGEVILDGRVLPPMAVDLGVGRKSEEPTFGAAPGPNIDVEAGLLAAPLVFVPRAETARDIVAWQLTIQRDEVAATDTAASTENANSEPEATNDGGLPGGDAKAPGVRGGNQEGAIRNVLRGLSAFSSSDDAGVVVPDGDAPSDVESSDAESSDATDGGPALLEEPPVASESVYVFAGEGPPPTRIEWDGKGDDGTLVVIAGQRYSAVFSVVVEGGDEGFSQTRPFGIAYGEAVGPPPPPAFSATLDASKGPLFSKSGRPLRRTRTFLDTVAADLKATESGPKSVTITVHSDAQPDAVVALTTVRALKVAEELAKRGVAKERLDAIGAGDAQPVRPNFTKRDRKANRRIVVEIQPPKRALAPVALPKAGRAISLNGEMLAEDATGRFAQTLETKVGETLTLDVTGPGVGRRVVVRAVTVDGFATAPQQSSATTETALSGAFAERRATIDDKEISLDLLGVRLEPEIVDDNGRAVAPIEGVLDAVGGAEVDLGFVPRLPEREGAEWVKWSFRVFEPMNAAELAEAGGESVSASAAGDASPPANVNDDATLTSASASDAPPGERSAADVVAAARDSARAKVLKREKQPSRLRLVIEREGTGPPPDRIVWTGDGQEGPRSARKGVTYYARLVVEDSAGNVAIAPDVPVVVDARPDAVSAFSADVKDPAFKSGKLKRSTRRALQKMAKALKKTEGPIVIGAHLDNAFEVDKAKAVTEQTANAARDILAKAGVDVSRMQAVGFGSSAPIAPNITSRSRKRNRRLEVRIDPPSSEVRFPQATPRVLANGRPLEIADGRFSGAVPVARSGEVTLMVKDATGARALVRIRPNASAYWRGRPEDLSAYVAEKSRRASAPVATAPASSEQDGGPKIARAEAPGALGDGGQESEAKALEANALLPYRGEGEIPDWWPTKAQVPAAQLSVSLPPDNAPLKSTTLVVRGTTEPTNTITIMGEPVPVDPVTGAFVKRLDTTRGTLALRIESTDVLGNKAAIDRAYQVDPSGWFFMLFAEAAAGQDGAQLSERADTTSVTLGDFFLYGRGVAYVKGDFTGDYVFKNYDLTFHADTRRWQEDVFARDVFDVDRFMPAYGDSSIEVQDAKAFYPIYLDLSADHSSARIGNLKTDLKGGDLFRYARSRYGASVEFDRGWSDGAQVDVSANDVKITDPKSDPWRTTARVFGAGGAANTRHARIELMGTGGSIFFLRHEDILEGSERIAIIVRDGITGAEIARQPKSRNVDYTIRYGEGRVVFKEPIPAFVDAGFTTNHNLGQVAAGHRVFIEVQYDHATLEPFQGLAGGGQVEQTLFGHLKVGGGYVYEGREDGTPAYQLAGMHARLFYDANTFLQAEWAWSQSVDAGNFISLDGGLTYQSLGQALDQKATQVGRIVFPAERQGLALKLDGQVAFGHFVGRNPLDGVVRAYAQYQSPGFFSGANIVEQGQTKWGLDANWSITDKDSIRLRYDSVLSEIPEIANVTEARSLHRHMATAGYSRQVFEGLRAGAELGYGYTWDSGAFGGGNTGNSSDVHTTVGALVVDWQLLDSLALSLKQEIIFTGDERQLNAWNDHFVTHAQIRYALSERLSLNVTESIRWNGENLTQVGLSWQVNDRSRVYATERLGFGPAGWNNSTVVGGETEVVDGTRMYAEYQMTGAFSGPQTRGVAGLANKWKLPFGFTLNFGYERTQVVGGNSQVQGNSVVAPGAFTDGTFYAAPGANGGGNALYGAGSRDAAYAGVEYRAGADFVASQRFELRYDNFDESRGGSDRLWAVSMTNATWALNPELSILARYNFALVQDIVNARQEARMEEGTLGAAYRPVTHDWVSVWAKLSRRAEVRPLSLKDGRFEDYTTHAASVEPIVELPFDLQLVEKLAFKHASQKVDDLPQADALTGLWINRVNWHVLRTLRRFDIDPIIPGDIDLGIEYRFLGGFTANTLEHGLLLEATIAPVEFFRMGIGWNFTRFSDNELARNDRDFGGFFIRAVGQY